MQNGDHQFVGSFKKGKIPLLLKLVFTALFLVTIPSNAFNYTLLNLLWLCDIAVIITFVGLWRESSLLLSMAALSAVPIQLAWQLDYFFQLISGNPLFGFTDYMFAPGFPLYNYVVSLFHVWMPYLVLYALRIVRYNRSAVIAQSILCCVVVLLSYFLTKDMFGPAGNLNQVYGMSDKEPQTWMAPWLWVMFVMGFSVLGIYAPTHFVFARLFKPKSNAP